MVISEIKGVIFDFGFTLFYFEEVSLKKYLDCYKEGLQKAAEFLFQEKVLTKETLKKQFIGKFLKLQSNVFRERGKGNYEEFTTIHLFRKLCASMNIGGIDENIWETLPNLFHSCEEKEWIPFQNTEKTLKRLNKYHNLKIGVLSNHPHHAMIRKVLEKYDLLNLFDAIITSAEFGMRKPHKDIFYYTMKKMGLTEADTKCTIMCGDEYADIMGAHRAGLQAVLKERKYKFPYEKEIPLKDLTKIKDISEILDYL